MGKWLAVVVTIVAGANAARGDDASPIVVVAPTSPIDFGMVTVGTPSDPQPIGVTNVSASTITLAAPTSDIPDFVVDTHGSQSDLAPGASTLFHVTFIPTKTASLSGHILFFEEGVLGPIAEASVAGNGGYPLGIIGVRKEGCSCALAVPTRTSHAGWAFLVAAIAILTRRRKLRAGGIVLASLIGFSSLARADDASPTVSLEPSSLDFGETLIRTTSDPQSIRIANVSAASIALGPPTSDSPAFQVDTSGFEPNLAVGATTTVHVTFAPQSVGIVTGHVSFFEEGVTMPIAEAALTGSAYFEAGPPNSNGCSCRLAARGRPKGTVWAILIAAIAFFVRRQSVRSGAIVLAIFLSSTSSARADDASPVVAVTPATPIDFGIVFVGTPSDPMPIGIKNVSSAPITLGTPTSDSPSFQIDATGFQQILAVDATTTLHVTFVPAGFGDFTGRISFFESSVAAPIAEVTGTGVGVAGLRRGAPPSSGCSCGIATRGRMDTAGWTILVAAIAIFGRRRRVRTTLLLLAIYVSGPSLARASNEVSITPASLEFGGVPVGSLSDSRTVSIENTSNAPLVLGDIDSDSDDFVVDVTHLEKNLLPGARTTASIVFAPSVAGETNDQLQIKLADGSTLAIAVHGAGRQYEQAVGCNVAPRRSFGDFAGLAGPILVAVIFLIGFRRGRRWGLFVLAIGTLLSVPSVAVADDAGAVVVVTPWNLDFGPYPPGSPSDPLPLELDNVGTAALVLDDPVSDSSAFTVDVTGANESLSANAKTTFHVTFVPPSNGDFSGHILFREHGVASPIAEIPVSGTGFFVAGRAPTPTGCSCSIALARHSTGGSFLFAGVLMIAAIALRRKRPS